MYMVLSWSYLLEQQTLRFCDIFKGTNVMTRGHGGNHLFEQKTKYYDYKVVPPPGSAHAADPNNPMLEIVGAPLLAAQKVHCSQVRNIILLRIRLRSFSCPGSTPVCGGFLFQDERG